jgi:DNA polymerase
MAPPGHVIVVRDLSQIEARINFWLAEQMSMVDTYRRGEDAYCKMATTIFSKPIKKKEHPKERFLGKTVTLGCGYGLGWKKFQGMLRVGMLGEKGRLLGEDVAQSLGVYPERFLGIHRKYVEESLPPSIDFVTHATHCANAERIIKTFRDNNPMLIQFWKTCQESLEAIVCGQYGWQFGNGGIIETCAEGLRLPNGMIMRYVELRTKKEGKYNEFSILRDRKKGQREKLYGGKVDENITQALARIVITDDMLRMQQEGIRCVHQVHDEILSVCPENQAEDVYKEMGIIMATPPSWAPDLPLASEGGWDRRYIK